MGWGDCTRETGFTRKLRFKEIRGVKVWRQVGLCPLGGPPQNPPPKKTFLLKKSMGFTNSTPEATTLEDHIFHWECWWGWGGWGNLSEISDGSRVTLNAPKACWYWMGPVFAGGSWFWLERLASSLPSKMWKETFDICVFQLKRFRVVLAIPVAKA